MLDHPPQPVDAAAAVERPALLAVGTHSAVDAWLAAAGLGGGAVPPSHHPMADDRTYMSNMSAELDALDLAAGDPSYRM